MVRFLSDAQRYRDALLLPLPRARHRFHGPASYATDAVLLLPTCHLSGLRHRATKTDAPGAGVCAGREFSLPFRSDAEPSVRHRRGGTSPPPTTTGRGVVAGYIFLGVALQDAAAVPRPGAHRVDLPRAHLNHAHTRRVPAVGEAAAVPQVGLYHRDGRHTLRSSHLRVRAE